MLSLRGTLVPKQPFPHLLKYPVNTYHIHTVIIFAFFKYTFFTEGNIWHKNNIFFANRSPPLWLADKYRAINGDYRGAYGCGNVNRSCAWSHHYIELFYNTCKFFNPVIADIFYSLSLYAADYPIQQFFLSGTSRNKNSSTCFPDYLVGSSAYLSDFHFLEDPPLPGWIPTIGLTIDEKILSTFFVISSGIYISDCLIGFAPSISASSRL